MGVRKAQSFPCPANESQAMSLVDEICEAQTPTGYHSTDMVTVDMGADTQGLTWNTAGHTLVATPTRGANIMSNYAPCDTRTLVQQIGHGNILAISGGRVQVRETGVTLPVHAGYRVTVDLAGNDTYTVRRIFERGPKTWVKGELTDVYADQLGEVAYQASCYVNVDFGEEVNALG